MKIKIKNHYQKWAAFVFISSEFVITSFIFMMHCFVITFKLLCFRSFETERCQFKSKSNRFAQVNFETGQQNIGEHWEHCLTKLLHDDFCIVSTTTIDAMRMPTLAHGSPYIEIDRKRDWGLTNVVWSTSLNW